MKKIFFLLLLGGMIGSAAAQGSVRDHAEAQDRGAHYQGEFAFGYGLGVGVVADFISTDKISFETVHGVRINPYLFTGLGVGVQYFTEWETTAVPFFLNLKGYCPVARKASLYLSWDLGAAHSNDMLGGTKFYTSIGPGIDFGNAKGKPRGDFSIRFQHLGVTGSNAVMFRIGVNF